MRPLLSALVIVVVMVGVSLADAETMVQVPAGTTVLLKFLHPLDSSQIKEGADVEFQVAADVLVDRFAVLRQGAPAKGTVTDVSAPGIFGKEAVVHIGFIQATAADGRPVRLSPLDVTPKSIHQVKDVGAAGASSVAGAILLGPLGLAAGALVHGGNVSVPAGAVATTKIEYAVSVGVP